MREQIRAAVEAAEKYAAENGVTSVQDMSAAPDTLRVYEGSSLHEEQAYRSASLGNSRCHCGSDWPAPASRANFGNEMLHILGC